MEQKPQRLEIVDWKTTAKKKDDDNNNKLQKQKQNIRILRDIWINYEWKECYEGEKNQCDVESESKEINAKKGIA